jgi:glutamate carboxypeptidase
VDEPAVIAFLRELVELESPTGDPGVRAVAERMATELHGAGGDVSFLGDHVRAELHGENPPLLLLGHTDTVWQRGTIERMPFRIEDGRAYGPGVYDMKGGLAIMVAALRRSTGRRRAVRVFLTADEEQGSKTAKPLLEEAAAGVAAAFVLEPALPRGGLKTARKGLGRFWLEVKGRAAHSGTAAREGASAIEELARQVIRLHALNDEERGITLNVGVIGGGTWANVVAAEARAEIDVRVVHAADVPRVEFALAGLEPSVAGTTLALTGGWTRPPLERSEGAARLFAQAREHGRALGLDLEEGSSGGGSDGNLVGAIGVPVLDGLGAVGGGAHAEDEHIVLASLDQRADLVARLIDDPGI